MTNHYSKHAEGHAERMKDYMQDLPPAERAEVEQTEARKTLRPQSQRELVYEALEVLGNGDSAKGEALLFKIAERLNHARKKHNAYEWKGMDTKKAITKAQDELNEQKYSAHHETPARVKDEGLDVIAVEIRILNDEQKLIEF